MMKGHPEVLILMGSYSDAKVMLQAKKVFDGLGIICEVRITSAHRTSERTRKLVKAAELSGVMIIIAGAGMAAHLAGVTAAETDLPVIGVPMTSERSPLGGVDALLSTVQMPPKIPVATVGINMADNAAWIAAKILALSDPILAAKLLEIRKEIADGVADDDAKLQLELANPAKKEE